MAVQLLVNAVDMIATNRLKTENPGFTLRAKGQRGVTNFMLQTTPSQSDFRPQIGYSVQWKLDGDSLFRGTIDTIVRKSMLDKVSGGYVYDCTVTSLEQRLDKRFVTRAFASGMTAGDVFTSIMNTEAVDEGITLGTIEDGATLDRNLVYEKARISDVFNDLAGLSDDFIWYIDHSTGAANFTARTTAAAPFSVAASDVLAADDSNVSLSRNEYRNRQWVKISEANLILEREIFQGDGATATFTLSKSIREIVSIALTTDVPLSIVGTFSGVPSDGDAIQIGGWSYTFKTAVPDTSGIGMFATAQNYVQIGRGNLGTLLADTILNLVAAVLDTGEGKGDYYSSTSIKNSFVDGATAGATTITITSGRGAYSNTTSFKSFNASVFTWGTPTAAEDGGIAEQTVGESTNEGTADFDWIYEAGGTTITLGPDRDPPAADQKLVVTYKPIGFGFVMVDDPDEIAARTAAEGASGIYENLEIREDILTVEDGLAAAAALLRSNGALAERVTIPTFRAGLLPGQVATIVDAAIDVNVDYLIQEVRATLLPTADGDTFKFFVLAVSGTQTEVDFFRKLANRWGAVGAAKGGGGASGGVSVQNVNRKKPQDGELVGWSINFKIDDDTTVGNNVTESYAPIVSDGKPYIGYYTVSARAADGSASSIYDIQYSPDDGENWYSIFPTGDSNKIVILAADGDPDVYFTQNPRAVKIENFADVNLKAGWPTRLTCVQGGNGATGLAFWIHGKPAGKTGANFNTGLPGMGPIVPLM